MSRSILIADDEEANRNVLQETFERKGYRVSIAGNGYEALDMVRASPGRVTLGIFDCHMPLLGGIDLLEQLRNSNCLIPILIVTSAPNENLRDRALASGAQGFFYKPLDVRGLRNIVSSLIGEETALTIHNTSTGITLTIKNPISKPKPEQDR